MNLTLRTMPVFMSPARQRKLAQAVAGRPWRPLVTRSGGVMVIWDLKAAR